MHVVVLVVLVLDMDGVGVRLGRGNVHAVLLPDRPKNFFCVVQDSFAQIAVVFLADAAQLSPLAPPPNLLTVVLPWRKGH